MVTGADPYQAPARIAWGAFRHLANLLGPDAALSLPRTRPSKHAAGHAGQRNATQRTRNRRRAMAKASRAAQR